MRHDKRIWIGVAVITVSTAALLYKVLSYRVELRLPFSPTFLQSFNGDGNIEDTTICFVEGFDQVDGAVNKALGDQWKRTSGKRQVSFYEREIPLLGNLGGMITIDSRTGERLYPRLKPKDRADCTTVLNIKSYRLVPLKVLTKP